MLGSPPDETAELDEALDALGHPHRRRLLTRLRDHNPLDVAGQSFDLAVEDTTAPEQLLLELYHGHLPKLAEAGYVDWDREAAVVRRGPRFDEVAPLIELLVAHADELSAGWP